MTIMALACLFGGAPANAQEPPSPSSCQVQEVMKANQGPESLIVGDDTGTTGIYNGLVSVDQQMIVYSASKLVTGVILMRMVEKGLLAINDKVSDHLPWWTTDGSDPRSQVEVYHLITQTAGFGTHICTEDNTTTPLECSQAIYNENYGIFTIATAFGGNNLLPDVDPSTVKPGQYYHYCESNFVLVGHIISQLTNLSWNEVFAQEIAIPVGMDNIGSLNGSFYWTPPGPGGGLYTRGLEYAKFLKAYFAAELVNSTSMAYIETPHTLLLNSTFANPTGFTSPSVYGHYGIGCWIRCDSDDCSGRRIMHSVGAAGFVPWVDRETNYWGIIVQYAFSPGNFGMVTSFPLMGEIRPSMEAFVASGQAWVDDCDLEGDNVLSPAPDDSEPTDSESGTSSNNSTLFGTDPDADSEGSASFMQGSMLQLIVYLLCAGFVFIF